MASVVFLTHPKAVQGRFDLTVALAAEGLTGSATPLLTMATFNQRSPKGLPAFPLLFPTIILPKLHSAPKDQGNLRVQAWYLIHHFTPAIYTT